MGQVIYLITGFDGHHVMHAEVFADLLRELGYDVRFHVHAAAGGDSAGLARFPAEIRDRSVVLSASPGLWRTSPLYQIIRSIRECRRLPGTTGRTLIFHPYMQPAAAVDPWNLILVPTLRLLRRGGASPAVAGLMFTSWARYRLKTLSTRFNALGVDGRRLPRMMMRLMTATANAVSRLHFRWIIRPGTIDLLFCSGARATAELQRLCPGVPVRWLAEILSPEVAADDPRLRRLEELAVSRGARARVVGMIGAFNRYKNPDLLIEAAWRLRDHSSLVFLIAGKGLAARLSPGTRSRLESCSTGPGANLLALDEWLPSDQVFNALLARIDILYDGHRSFDGTSNTLAKAAVFSKPVLAFASSPEIAATVKEHNLGLLIDPDESAAAVERAIIDLSSGLDTGDFDRRAGHRHLAAHHARPAVLRSLGESLALLEPPSASRP